MLLADIFSISIGTLSSESQHLLPPLHACDSYRDRNAQIGLALPDLTRRFTFPAGSSAFASRLTSAGQVSQSAVDPPFMQLEDLICQCLFPALILLGSFIAAASAACVSLFWLCASPTLLLFTASFAPPPPPAFLLIQSLNLGLSCFHPPLAPPQKQQKQEENATPTLSPPPPSAPQGRHNNTPTACPSDCHSPPQNAPPTHSTRVYTAPAVHTSSRGPRISLRQ